MIALTKYPGSGSEIYDLDCTARLAAAETLVSVDSMSFLPALMGADALLFGATSINASQIVYEDGVVAAVGKVVQVRISGGTSETNQPKREYSVIATCTTSAGNTLVVKAPLHVLTLAPLNNLP
jgi:hypothetical protein